MNALAKIAPISISIVWRNE